MPPRASAALDTDASDSEGAQSADDAGLSDDGAGQAWGSTGGSSTPSSGGDDDDDGWEGDWELNDDDGDAQVQLQWDFSPAELERAISTASIASEGAGSAAAAAAAPGPAASETCDCAETQALLSPVSQSTREDWDLELEALEAIFEEAFSANFTACCSLACPSVQIRVAPKCGTQHLYTDKWADVRVDLHPTYPSDPPDFTVVDSEGLNGGETMMLSATLHTAAMDEGVGHAGATIYDAIVAGQDLLTQMSTFVSHKRHKRDEAKALAAAAHDEAKRERARKAAAAAAEAESHPSIQVSPVHDPWVRARVPDAAKIVKMLTPLATTASWTVTPVVTNFLLSRFRAACTKLRCEPNLTFHGTDLANGGSIRRIGLIVPGQGDAKNIRVKNGTAYGQGVYSSPHMGIALSYARGSVFLCLVALGKSHPSPGNGPGCNSTVCGNIWVAYTAAQVLPVYEMRFTSTSAGLAYSGYTVPAVAAKPRLAPQELFVFKPARNPNERKKKKAAW